ncbi:MAG TPA: hypothetical protein VI750_05355 [Pyrinomonadaceae bacterium]|nr:hypothetical protein [Pyrinomonadaceae bacterium]
MRVLSLLVLAAIIWIGLAYVVCAEDGALKDISFSFGVLNGPTAEIRGEHWFLQGSWLMWTIPENDIDNAYVLRADYVLPLGAKQASQPQWELCVGYSLYHFSEPGVVMLAMPGSGGGSFSYYESGVNAQFIYNIPGGLSLRAGYDHLFNTVTASIDDLASVGLMYTF